jgi:polyphosphate glucokinase
VGGTHIKLRVTGMANPIEFDSGPSFTPQMLVRQVKKLLRDHPYSKVSIGYPGLVVHDRVVGAPYNLGRGWVGFNFRKALGRPVRVINDAAMQALGGYKSGRLLFLGLGTGLGSAMIVDGIVEPMELAHLPYKNGKTYEDYLGLRGLKKLGRKKWERQVHKVVTALRAALEAEKVVLGGGNVKKLARMPPGTIEGNNRNAFLGGCRLWTRRNRK